MAGTATKMHEAGATLPGAYAGRLLRVDLSAGRLWSEPWSPADMRMYLGGAGLGAKILWEEVPPEVGWDHPQNRLVLATGPLAGLPVWGTGGLTVVTRGAMTNGATSTQANGFFGATLKFSGYDAIVVQGQAPEWVYLLIQDEQLELRDARPLLGKDTWETQDALQAELGHSGHMLSVYSIGPAGENLVRFAAIQGDYGHVASKNGVGAVMGKKKLKAVAIVRGAKALRVADPRGLLAAADEIAHDLRTNPAARTLYEYGTLPGVVNLHALGALPIKNYTTSVAPPGVDMKAWEAPALREGFDHRGHQCSSCGMHHCHMQVLPSGKYKGAIVDEPEYEGWSGAGWTIGCTDPVAVSWLNTQLDRACVDVNEFGWLCGWVMECQEKGLLTERELGFRLQWGDAEGANRLLQMVSRRQGVGDLLAEGTKIAAERRGGAAPQSAI
jgi:aldehyde:ferredoxin oxidoreductase